MTIGGHIYLGAGSISPALAGSEIDGTRRLLDFSDVSTARLAYGGNGSGDCAIGVNFSRDAGTSWATLLAKGPNLATVGTVLPTTWTDVSFLQGMGDVLIAAFAYSSSLVTGLLYTVKFIDLQLR